MATPPFGTDRPKSANSAPSGPGTRLPRHAEIRKTVRGPSRNAGLPVPRSPCRAGRPPRVRGNFRTGGVPSLAPRSQRPHRRFRWNEAFTRPGVGRPIVFRRRPRFGRRFALVAQSAPRRLAGSAPTCFAKFPRTPYCPNAFFVTCAPAAERQIAATGHDDGPGAPPAPSPVTAPPLSPFAYKVSASPVFHVRGAATSAAAEANNTAAAMPRPTISKVPVNMPSHPSF